MPGILETADKLWRNKQGYLFRQVENGCVTIAVRQDQIARNDSEARRTMAICGLRFRAYAIALAASSLVGCGGQSASPALPQSGSQARLQAASGPWMLAEAKSEDLLYVGNGDGDIYAYSWPQMKLVGQLTAVEYLQTAGLCVDQQGDVFVPAWTQTPYDRGFVYEFAHGGTQPIATLTDSYFFPFSCSVDRTTGNLAVTSFDDGIAIYENAQGTPTYYHPPIAAQWVAYDAKGDLFASGLGDDKSEYPALTEMPSGGGTFKIISLNEHIRIFALQWNDGYLAAAYNDIHPGKVSVYRIKISGSAGKVIGTTLLNMRNPTRHPRQFLITGNSILAPGPKEEELELWRYPQGGKAVKTLIKPFAVYGIALSVASSDLRTRN
jgi:hypothetical protein